MYVTDSEIEDDLRRAIYVLRPNRPLIDMVKYSGTYFAAIPSDLRRIIATYKPAAHSPEYIAAGEARFAEFYNRCAISSNVLRRSSLGDHPEIADCRHVYVAWVGQQIIIRSDWLHCMPIIGHLREKFGAWKVSVENTLPCGLRICRVISPTAVDTYMLVDYHDNTSTCVNLSYLGYRSRLINDAGNTSRILHRSLVAAGLTSDRRQFTIE